LQQEDYGQFERQAVGEDFGARDFLRDTDARADLWDVRAGATVSPWTRLAFDAGYRHRASETDFLPGRDLDASPQPGNGYPDFIRARAIATDEVNARVVWRVATWVKASLKYQYLTTRYDSQTDPALDPLSGEVLPGGRLRAGEHRAHVYSFSASLTPVRRLLAHVTLSVSDAETRTGLATAAVAPYAGQIYTLLTSLSYALDARTELIASHAFARADYDPGQLAEGLPLGIVFDRHRLLAGVKRRFAHGLEASLQYGFFQHAEPTRGGAGDYTAHGVFAWLSRRFE